MVSLSNPIPTKQASFASDLTKSITRRNFADRNLTPHSLSKSLQKIQTSSTSAQKQNPKTKQLFGCIKGLNFLPQDKSIYPTRPVALHMRVKRDVAMHELESAFQMPSCFQGAASPQADEHLAVCEKILILKNETLVLKKNSSCERKSPIKKSSPFKKVSSLYEKDLIADIQWKMIYYSLILCENSPLIPSCRQLDFPILTIFENAFSLPFG